MPVYYKLLFSSLHVTENHLYRMF